MTVKKLVFGVGINDADYPTYSCRFYIRWHSMIRRCYSSVYQKSWPAYKGCVVCEDWLRFSNFKSWMEKQDWEGKHLDKDILGNGKLYSPETCCFILPAVNLFLIDRVGDRGPYPVGVTRYKHYDRYKARVQNPFTGDREDLGYYSTPELAHKAWLARKLELAKQFNSLIDDEQVYHSLVKIYENYGERNAK